MTNVLPFQWVKRAGERQLRPVKFLSPTGPVEITFFSVQILDEEGNDVTDELLDDTHNAFSGDTVQFMLIAGTAGQQYTVLVSAFSDETTELPIAEGILTVIA